MSRTSGTREWSVLKESSNSMVAWNTRLGIKGKAHANSGLGHPGVQDVRPNIYKNYPSRGWTS